MLLAASQVFNTVIGKMVTAVLWTSPLGIASLIAAAICRACSLLGTLGALGLWLLTVMAGAPQLVDLNLAALSHLSLPVKTSAALYIHACLHQLYFCNIAWRPEQLTVCIVQLFYCIPKSAIYEAVYCANGRRAWNSHLSCLLFAGLVIFGVVILPVAFWFISRRKPLEVARGFSKALILAFGTSSSSAALPVSVLPPHSPFVSCDSPGGF